MDGLSHSDQKLVKYIKLSHRVLWRLPGRGRQQARPCKVWRSARQQTSWLPSRRAPTAEQQETPPPALTGKVLLNRLFCPHLPGLQGDLDWRTRPLTRSADSKGVLARGWDIAHSLKMLQATGEPEAEVGSHQAGPGGLLSCGRPVAARQRARQPAELRHAAVPRQRAGGQRAGRQPLCARCPRCGGRSRLCRLG